MNLKLFQQIILKRFLIIFFAIIIVFNFLWTTNCILLVSFYLMVERIGQQRDDDLK